MLTIRLFDYPSGEFPVAFPANKEPTTQNWTDFAVPWIEGTGKGAGRYTADVDPDVSLQWVVFPTDDEPTDFTDAVTGLLFDLAAEKTLAEVSKIQRLGSAVAAGQAVTETISRSGKASISYTKTLS